MKNATFSPISAQQKERLAHIEYMVYFTGKVSRKDIMSRFDVGTAAATRDLSTYIDGAPWNILYDTRGKHYVITGDFQCQLPLSADKCLSTLSTGFGNYLEEDADFRPAHTIALEKPDLDITAKFSRAISLQRPVEIEYISTSSGLSRRVVCPHSLINNGLRWHVRAFDRKRGQFSDFVLNRVMSANLLGRELVPVEEKIAEDKEWNEETDLIIQPHPRLGEGAKAAIELEFKMENGSFTKRVRKALVGYMLNSWNVDSTPEARLKGRHILLHLKNANVIKEMEIGSFVLAPSLD